MSSLSSYFHRIPAWNEALLGDAQVLLDGPDMAHLNSRKSNLDQNINSLNGRQVVSLASTHIALLRQTYLPKNSLSCFKKTDAVLQYFSKEPHQAKQWYIGSMVMGPWVWWNINLIAVPSSAGHAKCAWSWSAKLSWALLSSPARMPRAVSCECLEKELEKQGLKRKNAIHRPSPATCYSPGCRWAFLVFQRQATRLAQEIAEDWGFCDTWPPCR